MSLAAVPRSHGAAGGGVVVLSIAAVRTASRLPLQRRYLLSHSLFAFFVGSSRERSWIHLECGPERRPCYGRPHCDDCWHLPWQRLRHCICYARGDIGTHRQSNGCHGAGAAACGYRTPLRAGSFDIAEFGVTTRANFLSTPVLFSVISLFGG